MAGPHVAAEFRGVGLTFPTPGGEPVVALSEATCRFEPSKVTAIIGPSGCGKSTLLQIVRGFLEPSRGDVMFIDRGSGASAARPAMSTVWQAFNLFPWLTVLENVAFGLEVRGMAKRGREELARKAITSVDLGGFESKYPRQLSGGMRQRVGLARALVMKPDILLLDEPFGSLDAQTRLVLQEQLARLVEESGMTAILVTHSIEEAILLADTIIVMSARPGRVVADIAVELPRPRSLTTTQDPRYSQLFDRIYGLLRDEVMRAIATESGV
jgi:NitT/TauT family transport system ATP-binding protein